MARDTSELPAVRAPDAAPVLHFDTSVWVALTRARLDERDPFHPLWGRLLEARDSERIQVALSNMNYLEVWNRRERASRERLGRTIALLSGYVSLRDIDQLTDAEVSLAVTTRREGGLGAKPARLSQNWVLDTGARHAFDSEMGRFRFVESIESDTEPEGASVDPPAELVSFFRLLETRNFEWIQLVGVDDGHNLPGIDFRPSHRHGDKWVDQQEHLRQFVRAAARDESLLYRAIVLQRLEAIRPSMAHVTSPDELDALVPSPTAGVALIGMIPTEHVIAELLFQAHRNPAYRFRQHDQADIYDLAHSIPYCDVVVADKTWAHLANAGRLGDHYDARILSRSTGLARWADENLA